MLQACCRIRHAVAICFLSLAAFSLFYSLKDDLNIFFRMSFIIMSYHVKHSEVDDQEISSNHINHPILSYCLKKRTFPTKKLDQLGRNPPACSDCTIGLWGFPPEHFAQFACVVPGFGNIRVFYLVGDWIMDMGMP